MPDFAVPPSLRALVEQLPFDLDDTAQAGRAFQRWRAAAPGDGERAKRTVDLWTYCFVRRYFLVKFAVAPARPAADLDELVERVYRKVEDHRASVRQPRRYPHWVSVVCKNTFLNYVRREHPATVSLQEEERPPLPAEERVRGDLGLAHEVVAAAIGRLPDYLQPVAQMRFLEDDSYKTIGKKTETAVPTVRSYAGRARRRLREDPAVRALLEGPAE